MIGFRIAESRLQASPDLLVQFAGLQTANISDCMYRVYGGEPGLKPMHSGGALAASALTVRVRPGDNLLVHKAIDMAMPGQAIVVDAGGQLTNAIIGELMVRYAEKRGIAGIVIYGAIRDSEFVRQGRFPVYALGVNHRGPYKDGPGEINYPVSLSGMVVEPGDIVIGDADGIVSIPLDDAERVLADTLALSAKEAAAKEAIRNGTNDRSWVDATLTARGFKGNMLRGSLQSERP